MARLARSFLYVPGDRPDRVAKALHSEADAVIIDLEDAVKPDAKPLAREAIRSLPDRGSKQLWVRINSGDDGLVDLELLADVPPIHGVVVAKCDSVEWLDAVALVVDGSVLLSPLIETAVALCALDALCAHQRVTRCHLGDVDLLADLGGRLPGGRALIERAGIDLVVASAAAGIEAPVGGVHLQIDDLETLATTSVDMADLGFGGRAIVHPSHCAPVNAAFTPAVAELAWAVDALERSARSSEGAIRAADGTMIDEAVLRRARRLVGD
ncbi:MAG: CoA ester lyase [Ilumatobacteraceae bacterium]